MLRLVHAANGNLVWMITARAFEHPGVIRYTHSMIPVTIETVILHSITGKVQHDSVCKNSK